VIELEVQRQSSASNLPSDSELQAWVSKALEGQKETAELVVRIVDADEIQALNAQYRHKDKPTNVLSFPSEIPEIVASPLLGDIVICAGVVADEAQAQGKPLMAHWAHMIVHGVLHLLGYDHIVESDAQQMEHLECSILSTMGFQDPYLTERIK
jgi:probable rRNA maturation factor